MIEKFIIFIFFTIQPDNSTIIHYTIEQELNNKQECMNMARDIFYYSTPVFRKSNVLTLDTQCLMIPNNLDKTEKINLK
tara:strand:+ start:5709 stop:5945 length:237 start_codon:yes stop_codon:yes gene_type:complete